jgi:hypothetical protein
MAVFVELACLVIGFGLCGINGGVERFVIE